MTKRIIAVIAALAMLYGTTLIKAEGTDERTEVSTDQGRADGEGHEEVPGAGGTDYPGRIAPVRITETDTDKTGEGGKVNGPEDNEADTGADAGAVQEGPDGTLAVTGTIGAAGAEPEYQEPVSAEDSGGSGEDGENDGEDSGEDVTPQLSEEDATFEEYSEAEPEWTYYGNCRITHYCTGPCCCGIWAGGGTANGEDPIPYWTVANGALPFGTHVLINGQEYCVTDRGVDGDQFDILVSSHEEALALGLYYTDVYVKW